MSVTGSSNITSLATASPLAALAELDDPDATSAPAGMNYLIFKYEFVLKMRWSTRVKISHLVSDLSEQPCNKSDNAIKLVTSC